MSLGDDLKSEVRKIFAERWTVRDGRKVPEDSDLKLSNDAVHFERATFLYADLSASTALVEGYKWTFAAEVYKTFLVCAARVIKHNGGEITAYDGDRIMAAYIGNDQATAAAKTALQINYCGNEIINPALKKQYPETRYRVGHVVGVDTSETRVARTGVRGANDLVWVGPAANYAAKLSDMSSAYHSWITKAVYDRLHESSKIGNDGRNMWEQVTWNGATVFRSSWWMSV